MPISGAEFALWLKRGGSNVRVWLCELDYRYQDDEVSPPDYHAAATRTLYLANRAYQTQPGDTPPNVAYSDVIRSTAEFSREIDRRTLTGRAAASVGAMELDNVNGALDFLANLPCEGSETRWYVGDPSWSRADFRHMFTALVERINPAPSRNRIVVDLRDGTALLNASIGGDFIGGLGPNAQRSKPVNFGYCINVELFLEDPLDHVYRYGASGDLRLAKVRDSGLSISDLRTFAGTD